MEDVCQPLPGVGLAASVTDVCGAREVEPGFVSGVCVFTLEC